MTATEVAQRAAGAVALSLSFALPALAQEWEVEPKLALAAVYSDNILLAETNEESETVGQFAPSIAIRHDDERLDVDLNYLFQYLAYSRESGRSESFHDADAHVLAELVRQRFFVDLDGGIGQQLIDPEQAFPPSSIPLSGNRIDAVDANIAPYWIQPVGALGDIELRYERGIVEYDDDVLAAQGVAEDLDRQEGHATLESPAHRRGTTWGLDYRYVRQEFSVSEEAEFEEASAQLGYWVTGSVRVFGVGGKESDYREHRSEAELDEPFWEVGMNYSVAERDDFELRVGERSFGSTAFLRWLHEFRQLRLHVDYSEEPTTSAETLFERRAQPVDIGSEAGLDRPTDTDVFLRKRFQTTLELNRARSEWALAAYAERREDRISAANDPNPGLGDEETAGTSFDVLWQAGAHTDIGFGADWERSSFDTGADFDLWHVSAEAAHDIGNRTALRLRLERSQRHGEQTVDYDENRLSLFFERNFY